MSEAPSSLGDFFKAKAKKKIKSTNLNKETTVKPEETKKKTKPTEDDAWEEEQVVASTMKVEVAGKLMREEEKKDDEDTAAPAWGAPKAAKGSDTANVLNINEKRFPTLAKSVGSSAINVDDGSDPKVNIQTSKNVFAALEGDDEEDDDNPKRPKEINPALVTKKKGEREQVAIQREIEKVTGKETKKKSPKDEEDEDEDEKAEAPEKKKTLKKEKEAKPAEKQQADAPEEKEEDLKIPFDMVASKEKYKGRKKLPPKELPKEELEEEKENKPKKIIPAVGGGKKKKTFANFDDDDDKKKLMEAPDDW